MYIHREGKETIIYSLIISVTILYFASKAATPLAWLLSILAVAFFLFILSFFRNPDRTLPHQSDSHVYAPADGKVVVIEETTESEYLKTRCRQISIFMSPLNVHVNRNPISGTVDYEKYHKGKYLVAWHPKSSTENERHTTVLSNAHGKIVVRQIAGALARRIVNYLSVNDTVVQGSEMGFIKFGSRVDIFLPLDAKIEVSIGQKVQGNVDIIAQLS